MISLLQELQKQNGLQIRAGKAFGPSSETLLSELRALPESGVYHNHAGCVASKLLLSEEKNSSSSFSQYAWINMVREPIDRVQSVFYYAVDPVARSVQAATDELARRRRDEKCGCAELEFDACVELRAARGCPQEFCAGGGAQHAYFCEPPHDDSCTLEVATRSLRDNYALVGLTEEFDISIDIFERILPQFFKGASEALVKMSNDHQQQPRRSGSLQNNLTGTSEIGAVSKAARAILMNFPSCRLEQAFYEAAKRHFWRIAAEVLADELEEA